MRVVSNLGSQTINNLQAQNPTYQVLMSICPKTIKNHSMLKNTRLKEVGDALRKFHEGYTYLLQVNI